MASIHYKRENLKHKLFDKLKGIIYGAALGDAVGLSTEFMTEKQARVLYGVGPIKFGTAKGHEFWRDRHRAKWFPHDFTDDTDQMLLILQCLLASDGHLIPTHFAYRLMEWIKNGFPEMCKPACGIGYTVGSVLSHEEFLADPHKAAYDVWDTKGRNLAANGAVMRTAVLGVPYFWNEVKVVENTMLAAKVTHSDPRSVISSIIVSVVISKLLLQVLTEEKITLGKLVEKINTETQKNIVLLLEAGSPKSHLDYNVLAVEDFKQYDTTLKPKPKALPPQPPPKTFLKRVFSFTRKEQPTDELSILSSFFPQYDPPESSRLKNPVKIPEKLPPNIDSLGPDADLMSLCKNIVQGYEFILTSSSLSKPPTKPSTKPPPESTEEKKDAEGEEPNWVEELHAHCFPAKLADLKLSDPSKIGYTYKCLGSGIYCFTRAKPPHQSSANFFKSVITELTLQAGDADTNGAVAGALLGCRLGKEGLPKDWLSGLRNSEFLETTSMQLCNLVWAKYNER